MGQDNNKGSGDTEVSAYEHELTKQGKVNKNIKTTTYSDKKTSAHRDESNFHTAGQKDKIETPFTAFNIIGNMTLGWTNAGSKKTREYFTGNVLTSKGYTHKGTHYGKESFNQLSAEKKEEIFGEYLSDRTSGKTDAYGNPIGGWRKETIKHRKADGTMTTREVWMGGNDNDGVQQKSETQILQENVTASKKDQAVEEQADYSKKKRLSVKSSRSLFANEGGRGFFN
mgnify:CR=1 FL=1